MDMPQLNHMFSRAVRHNDYFLMGMYYRLHKKKKKLLKNYKLQLTVYDCISYNSLKVFLSSVLKEINKSYIWEYIQNSEYCPFLA